MPTCGFWNVKPPPGRPPTKCWTWRCGFAAGRRTARKSEWRDISGMRAPPESWPRPPMFYTTFWAKPFAACRFSEEPDAMSNKHTLLLGAVGYDPKVVTIWDGFQAYFQKLG